MPGNIHAILDKLDKVQKSGDQYQARCPAHDDSDPSLSLRELADGRILIHCHAGCSGREVLGALGMSLSDLYPEALSDHVRPLYLARKHKQQVDHERLILAIADADRAKGKKLSPKDLKRERDAYMKLRELEEVHH